MEYYFKPDDRLERLKYAEFLKTLLLNCDKYRREDSDGAYVIALDSPWGTGKTRFVKMLRNYLEGNKPRIINDKVDRAYTPKLNEGRLFNVVYYNAWDTDFSTDALEPLFYSLLKSPELAPDQFDAAGNEILEKFENATKEMLKAAGYALSHFVLGEAATTVLKSGIDAICAKQPNPYENYEKRLELISNFREALTAVIDATKQKKLVIIIDELDRCRPTFAIETLEIAKHLFAVKGLVFIFALDIEQLSYSVQTVYGQNMDAQGYLCRFFDYFAKIPAPDRRAFIYSLLEQIDTRKEIFDSKSTNQTSNEPYEVFMDYACSMIRHASVSFRNITTLFETYKIMLDSFLGRYKSTDAFIFYFYLLFLKLKFPSFYNFLVSDNVGQSDVFSFLEKHKQIFYDDTLEKQLKVFIINDSLEQASLQIYPLDYRSEDSLDSHGGINRITITENGKEPHYIFQRIIGGGVDNPQIHVFECDGNICLDYLFYYEDMKKWEEIKSLTPAQYFRRQLEMFDFVLPADEAKAAP